MSSQRTYVPGMMHRRNSRPYGSGAAPASQTSGKALVPRMRLEAAWNRQTVRTKRRKKAPASLAAVACRRSL